MGKLTPRTMKSCKRCGTCCKRGGPVLHYEDMKILRHHHAQYAHLVTIRRGELTYNPVSDRIEQAWKEMVKVAGSGDTWSCCFYREEDAACLIYGHRFLECRLLKCWEPAEIMSIIGRNTIRRSDVINKNDPVMHIIEQHEEECSLLDLKKLIDEVSVGKESEQALRTLSVIVQKDTAIRKYALSDLGIKPEYELFIFGRPVKMILRDAGFVVKTEGCLVRPG